MTLPLRPSCFSKTRVLKQPPSVLNVEKCWWWWSTWRKGNFFDFPQIKNLTPDKDGHENKEPESYLTLMLILTCLIKSISLFESMLKSLEKLGLYIAKSTLSCCWRECASRIITSPRRVVLLFVGSDKSKIVADVLLLAHFARESIVWQMKIKFFYLQGGKP